MTVEYESKLAKMADERLLQLDRIVENALETPRRVLRVLTGVVIALVIGTAGLGYLYVNETDLAHTACLQSNTQRADDSANWDYFLQIAVHNDKKPSDLALVRKIEAHVAQGDAQRNCATGYGW